MTTMRNRAVVSHADAMSDEIPDPEVPERAKRPRSYSAHGHRNTIPSHGDDRLVAGLAGG
jgi:hypothetical protein